MLTTVGVMRVRVRSGLYSEHIPEVVSYPATINVFICKTSVDDNLNYTHKIIYLCFDFFFRQVKFRIAVCPLDYFSGQIGQCYMQRTL